MVFRVINGVMAVLFSVAVAVQYNDPDPIGWMAIYSAACVLSLWACVRGSSPLVPAVLVGIVALLWSFEVGRGVVGRVEFADMFQSWEMKSPMIEEAREASGLLIVAFWMAVQACWVLLRRRQGVNAGDAVPRPFHPH